MKRHHAISAVLCGVFATTAWACTTSTTKAPAGGTLADGGGADSAVTTDLGSFTLECGTGTKDFAFAAATTEVIRFEATWKTTNNDSVPDAVVLDSAGNTIDRGGNPLGLSPGLVSTTDVPTVLVHEFFTAGSHTLRFNNSPPGCSPITVSTKYTRVAPAVTNTAQASAISLTKGTPSASHIGCSTERWYKLTAASGEALSIVVTGERFAGVPTEATGTFTVDLLDGAGQPVMVSGNAVSVLGEIGNAGSQIKVDHTATEAGTFHVKMTQSGCIAPVTYSIAY